MAGEDVEEVIPGHQKLQLAGIESTAYGGRGYLVIVTAPDFNRAREILLSDPTTRRFVVTKVQFARWRKSHPADGEKQVSR